MKTDSLTNTIEDFTLSWLHKIIEKISHHSQDWIIPHSKAHSFAEQILDLVFHQFMTRKMCATFLWVSIRTIDRLVSEAWLPSHFRSLQAGKRAQRVFVLNEVLKWQFDHLDDGICPVRSAYV